MIVNDDPLDNYRQVNCEQTDSYNVLNTLLDDNHTAGLKLFHINIRSYHKNFDNLLILLEAIRINFEVIVLSEAWLDDCKNLTDLNDYDMHFTTRYWNRNDGLIVYTRAGFCVTSRQVTLGEATGLELTFDVRGRLYDILAVYRSPSTDYDLFSTDLKMFYANVNNNTTYVFLGDVNVDIIDSINTADKDDYLNFLSTVGFMACIDKPTRVTDGTSTCIDHIFIRHSDYRDITAAVLTTDITDHYAVTARIDYRHTLTPDTAETDTYVDTTMLDRLLRDQSWEAVLAADHVNNSCNIFLTTFNSLKKFNNI